MSRPEFRRFWAAQSLAYLGDMVSWIALPLVAVEMLQAPVSQVGVLTAVAPLPTLLLGAHVGAFVDRHSSEFPIMRTAAIVRAVVLGTVPLAAAIGALTFAHLLIAAVLVGTASVFFNVAASTALPGMCNRDELVRANSATRMSFSAAAVAGPGLGGVLTQIASAADALLFDSVAFALSSILLLRLRHTHTRPGNSRLREAGSKHGDVRVALRAIRRDRTQIGLLIAATTGIFGFSAYFTILLVFATRDLNLSAGQLGTALGIGAVGALAGSVSAAPISRAIGVGRTLLIGAVTYPGILIAVAFAPPDNYLWAIVVLASAEFLSSAALMLADIPAISIQQSITPAHLLGRVRGITLAANYGARTIAALSAGVVAELLGSQIALIGFLAVATAAGCLIALTPVTRIHHLY